MKFSRLNDKISKTTVRSRDLGRKSASFTVEDRVDLSFEGYRSLIMNEVPSQSLCINEEPPVVSLKEMLKLFSSPEVAPAATG